MRARTARGHARTRSSHQGALLAILSFFVQAASQAPRGRGLCRSVTPVPPCYHRVATPDPPGHRVQSEVLCSISSARVWLAQPYLARHVPRGRYWTGSLATCNMPRTCSVWRQVTPDQFIAVWKRFGLVLTPQLAAAFFDKYGRDARGLMPVMVRAVPLRDTCHVPDTLCLAALLPLVVLLCLGKPAPSGHRQTNSGWNAGAAASELGRTRTSHMSALCRGVSPDAVLGYALPRPFIPLRVPSFACLLLLYRVHLRSVFPGLIMLQLWSWSIASRGWPEHASPLPY